MRLVLDTNVALSALLWRGTPYQMLTIIRDHADTIKVVTSAALLTELAEVLARPRHTQRLTAIGKSTAAVMSDYVAIVEIVAPTAVPAVVVNDPDDDQVLACALAGSADLIISGDKKHLLALGSYQGIPIVTTAEAIKKIAA